MLEVLSLGAVQGFTEWLPVSSQGVVTSLGTLFSELDAEQALALALWLHLGTGLAATCMFRRDIRSIVLDCLRRPLNPSPESKFVVISVVSSGIVGFPLLLLANKGFAILGSFGMVHVGIFMIIGGIVMSVRGQISPNRTSDVQPMDAVLVGIAQGFAAFPGLSRSGLTVAVLLLRGIDRTKALRLSFVMGIPVTFASGMWAGLDSGILRTQDGIWGAVVAFGVGLATIRLLLGIAAKIDFTKFLYSAGILVVLGGLWQVGWGT